MAPGLQTRHREGRGLPEVTQLIGRMRGPRGGLTSGQIHALDQPALQGQAEREGRPEQGAGGGGGKNTFSAVLCVCPPSDPPGSYLVPTHP